MGNAPIPPQVSPPNRAAWPLAPTHKTSPTPPTTPPTRPRTVLGPGPSTAAPADTPVGAMQRPLDWPATVSGTQGQWVEFTHTLGPDPQTLHPVKVYSQDYGTLWGVGKYATAFGAGTASYDMFGDGRDAFSYTHLRAHETVLDLVCRLLLEKKKNHNTD